MIGSWTCLDPTLTAPQQYPQTLCALGLYRTLLQPLVQAFVNDESAQWLHRLNPAELPYELFSEKNPLMRQVAEFAKQVREQRVQSTPDNPFIQLQEMMSSAMISPQRFAEIAAILT